MSQNPYNNPNNPYGSATPGQPTDAFGRPKQGGGALKWILLVVGGLGLLGLCCCGGAVWMGYSGFSGIMGMMSEEARTQFANDPVVQAQLGGLDTLTINLTRTGEVGQQSGRQNVMVYDAKGPKGTGELHVQFDNGGQPAPGQTMPPITWAELVVNGQTFPLRGDDETAGPGLMTPAPDVEGGETESLAPGEPGAPAPALVP